MSKTEGGVRQGYPDMSVLLWSSSRETSGPKCIFWSLVPCLNENHGGNSHGWRLAKTDGFVGSNILISFHICLSASIGRLLRMIYLLPRRLTTGYKSTPPSLLWLAGCWVGQLFASFPQSRNDRLPNASLAGKFRYTVPCGGSGSP